MQSKELLGFPFALLSRLHDQGLRVRPGLVVLAPCERPLEEGCSNTSCTHRTDRCGHSPLVPSW